MLDHARVESIDRLDRVCDFMLTVAVREPVQTLGQAAAGMMQKAGCIFGSVHHLKFADVERIDLRKISAAPLFHARQHSFQLPLPNTFAREQSPQHRVRRVAVHLWQHVDQKLRLRAIMRRVAIDFEKNGQAVDQVVNCRSEVAGQYRSGSIGRDTGGSFHTSRAAWH